jgi:hypothetical protein
MSSRPPRAGEGPPPSAGAPEQPPVVPAEEPPPFLGRWSRVYALVVLELIAIIALCGWLSRRH